MLCKVFEQHSKLNQVASELLSSPLIILIKTHFFYLISSEGQYLQLYHAIQRNDAVNGVCRQSQPPVNMLYTTLLNAVQ